MATPFKLKSGNASAFKNLGSSPAKQKDFNFTGDKASTTPKYNIKKKGNFNFTGDSKSTTPKYSTTKAAKTQNFRNEANKIKTVSSKTNVKTKVVNANKSSVRLGSKNTLKSELKKGTKQFVESAKGQMKGLNPPKVSSKIVKIASEAGKAARFAGKAVSAAVVPLTLYDMYKSGQKQSGGKAVKGQKSFLADAKKNTKSIFEK